MKSKGNRRSLVEAAEEVQRAEELVEGEGEQNKFENK